MKNPINLVKNYKEALIVLLNYPARKTLTHRYQIYVKNENEFLPLDKIKNKRGVKYQVNFPKNRELPESHFAIKSLAEDPANILKKVLLNINPEIKVYILNGW